MHPEIGQNFTEKLRLTVAERVGGLDLDIKAMLAEHSAEGMLRSGNTIKKHMWYKDPNGNYEPVTLGLALSLIALAVKFGDKR